MGPRLASAAVLITVVAGTLYLGSYVFASVVGAVYAGVYREWETMITRAPVTPLGWILTVMVGVSGVVFPLWNFLGSAAIIALAALFAVIVDREFALWRIAGLALMGTVVMAVLAMRGDTDAGIVAGVYLGTVVWMTDSAAFFTGRQIGGEKLAPDISPSKTWSGALGGLALGTGAGLAVWIIATDSPWWLGLVLSATISILGQLGDLAESGLKRHFRIKDSGHLIPGHGGLMDRLDSLTFGVILVLMVGGLHAGFGSVAEGLLYW